MNSVDKAIKILDALKDDVNSEREMNKILDDCEKAINMVNTQINKLNAYSKKLSKYKYGGLQYDYVQQAIRDLEKGMDNALTAIERAR